jgi:hypothetical protein
LLKNSGVLFDVHVSDVNEETLRIDVKHKNPKAISALLADAKTHAVS